MYLEVKKGKIADFINITIVKAKKIAFSLFFLKVNGYIDGEWKFYVTLTFK